MLSVIQIFCPVPGERRTLRSRSVPLFNSIAMYGNYSAVGFRAKYCFIKFQKNGPLSKLVILWSAESL